MDTTVQKNNIKGPPRTNHGLQLHTLVHGMDYLVPLWWKVRLVGGSTGGGGKDLSMGERERQYIESGHD